MDPQGFKNPDSILRPAPFWAINERITPEETAEQMSNMIDVGLSGGFFHSRAGLVTDYLGEDWFKAMEAALEVAREKDGYLWLYDEDLWPSGNAGGQVAGMKDEYRSTILSAVMVAAGEPAPVVSEDQVIRYCYAIRERDGLYLKAYDQVPLDDLDSAKDFERLFLIRAYTAKIGWWGGESYANLLHPEAMQKFIEMTHEVYYKKLGDEFGKRIPGIFTDEPQVAFGHNSLAWYEGLPEKYREWHGRDWWQDYPFMFFDGPKSRNIRLLINRTVQRQFLEAFSKPIFEWCEAHGIQHTGHYNAEDAFWGQIMCHCGSIMAHYRYQQAPGIDHLCRNAYEALFTCKQVESAARQLGRTRVLTEIFGVSRHTNTFEDFKWLGDYDLVNGANFFCPHLTWYSAKGRRKRDYPPVWNYQQTYWNDLKPLNDYFTRVGYALTRGKASSDIVLLHSIESAIAARRMGVDVVGTVQDNARKVPVNPPTEYMHMTHVLDQAMRKTLDAILNAGYECDLGDEGYMEDMGRVDGESFGIGEMSYKVVVVPQSITWRPNTFSLLKRFVDNGGKVIVVGEIPSEIDGVDAREKWVELVGHDNVMSVANSTREIQAAIDEVAPKMFSLKGADGSAEPYTYVHHRVDGDQDILFITNSDKNNARDYVLTFFDAQGKDLVKWDPVDGTCENQALRAWKSTKDIRYAFHLPPSGSLLVTLGGNIGAEGRRAEKLASASTMTCPERELAVPVEGEFDFERKDANVLVMDRISVSFDGGKTFETEDFEWRVRRGIAKRYGTEAALEWQPWVAIRKGLFTGKGGDIVLRYRFASDLEKPKSFVVIEDIQKGKLTVNGTPVDVANPDWHWDKGFGKVEISTLVKRGENVVDFAVHYDHLTEVEPAYVVGDFGVELVNPFQAKIVDEPAKLKVGPWNDQGYPFYSGKMVYKTTLNCKEVKRTFIRLVRPSGILYKVRVNGQDAGNILWRPWEKDITSLLKAGDNTVEIEVVSSLQNSWGPLHEEGGDDNRWCGPNAFEDDNILREEINTYPYGLIGGAEIVTL